MKYDLKFRHGALLNLIWVKLIASLLAASSICGHLWTLVDKAE